MRMLFALLVGLLALPVSAEIYRYTDAKGNTVFTNQPPADVDSRAVTLSPANSLPAQPATAYPSEGKTAEAPAESSYQRLELIDLPDADAIRANNGNFNVQVAIEPQLAPGHQLRLLLDGQPYGEPGTSTGFQLINVDRGSHSLAVEVLAGERSIQRSSPVTIHVQRVHQ